jgi:hypothetical protein
MTDLLERTHREPLVPNRLPTVSGPPKGPPRVEVDVSTPWPRSAKIVSILLLIAAIVGAFGTMIRADSVDDPTLVTEQRDTLRDANLALQSELDAATGERDALAAEVLSTDADVAALTGRNVELRLMTEALAAERNEAIVQRNVLTGELAAQTERTAAVTVERDELAALLPMTFDATLTGVDLVGIYDLAWDQIYCDGLTNCGTVPAAQTATITANDVGWLTITIDGFMTGMLDRTDGSLSTVVDNTTATPPIANSPRVSRVAINIYAHGITVLDDGTRRVDDLGASIVVNASPVSGFAAGVALYGLTLTPR